MGREHLDAFRTKMFGVIAQMLEEEPSRPPRLEINAHVSLGDLDDAFMDDVNKLEPFGAGNPEPIMLASELSCSRTKVVGKKHLRSRFHDSDGVMDGIGFSMAHHKDTLLDDVSVAFVPSVSRRRGQHRLEMHIKDMRPAAWPAPDRVEHVGAEKEPATEPAEVTHRDGGLAAT